ncbi:MAG: TetR/AcrR family transcriptional regulator [Solirubrobacteraceae bacterium]
MRADGGGESEAEALAGVPLTPLYKRLPHGPHGMGREAVARHQRARIFGGMVESVYQRGYAATSVAHVIALAGVSRRAFYEQFSNKEECFLTTYDALVASARKRVLRAWMSERGWANRLYAALQAFLSEISHDPRPAYLVLIEAPGMGVRGNERTQVTATAFERIVATGFSLSPDRIALPPLAPRAIVGGVRLVVSRRLRDQRERELAGLTDELLDWIASYRSSSVVRLRTLGSSAPPPLPARKAKFLERKDKRSLLMDSLVQLSLDEGYVNISDADIARHAGTTTESFHREFNIKDECLLAVVDEFAAEALDAVWSATRLCDSWPEAVQTGVRALIGFCAAHPGLVRLTFVDVFDSGNGVAERLRGLMDGFLKVMTRGVPDPQRAPAVAAEAILGAVWAILSSYAPHDRLRYLPCLVDHLTYLILAPYIGPRAAVEAIEDSHNSAGQLPVS